MSQHLLGHREGLRPGPRVETLCALGPGAGQALKSRGFWKHAGSNHILQDKWKTTREKGPEGQVQTSLVLGQGQGTRPPGSSRGENHPALTACPELGSGVPGPEAEPLCLCPIPTPKHWASAEAIVSSSHGCLDFAVLI